MHNRRTQRADVKHMRTGDSLLRLGALSWETKFTTDEGNMAEFFSNPSLLTKDRLKAELQANGISLPKANQKKDFYVDLYLKHLTSRNSDSPGKADFYSSDEEESTPRRRSVQVRNPSPASKTYLYVIGAAGFDKPSFFRLRFEVLLVDFVFALSDSLSWVSKRVVLPDLSIHPVSLCVDWTLNKSGVSVVRFSFAWFSV